MDKTLMIDGKGVGFRASALTPRLYRHKFHRDMVQDFNRLIRNYNKAMAGVPAVVYPADVTEDQKKAIDQEHDQAVQDAQMDVVDLEIFENAAYIMARQFDANIPADPDAWLDGFSTFSIYDIMPELLQLWELQQQTTAKPKNV